MASKVWGAITLIAGTTIGAGMLAFPLVTIKVGLVTSFAIMAICWVVMYVTAMLTAKVILTYSKNPLALPVLAEKLKFSGAALVGHIVTIVLFYSLMTAYIVGGASILKTFIPLSDPMLMSVFAGTLGVLIVGKTAFWDSANRLLFGLLTLAFLAILLMLAPCCRLADTAFMAPAATLANILSSVPIFFTAFAFHGSIPVALALVGPNMKDIKRVFLIGSLIPLVLYMLWQYTAFTAFPAEQKMLWATSKEEDLGQFLSILGAQSGFRFMNMLTSLFGLLAIVTSFLGVGLGLCAYLQNLASRKGENFSAVKLFWLAVGIPLGCAIIYPSGFLEALGFAALMLCVLVILLPAYLAWQQREKKIHTSPFLLSLLVLFALMLFAIEGGRILAIL